MDESDLFIIFILLVISSGFLRLAEVSLLSLKKSRIKRGGVEDPGQRWLNIWVQKSEEFLTTIFLLNTIVRISAVLVLFLFLEGIAGSFSAAGVFFISVGLAALIIWVFAEVLPRIISRRYSEAVSKVVVTPLRGVNFVFKPLVMIFHPVVSLLRRVFNLKEAIFSVTLPDEELMDVLEVESSSGGLEEEEKELISSIFEFRDTIAREVMVPRVDMVCVEQEATLSEVHKKILLNGHSRIPVYKENIDSIIGVFFAKDLLKYIDREKLNTVRVKDVMHDVIFVPETKNVGELLREFQKKHMHIAIVVDEYGGTAGLVTIEDLLEEIVGEIQDEFDKEEKLFTKESGGGYVVDAKMSIDEIAEKLNIKLPESEDYDTIGGYIFTSLGKVPEKNEVFEKNGVQITVLEADDRRIHKVRLVSLGKEKESEEEK